jgi:hypothetical protein
MFQIVVKTFSEIREGFLDFRPTVGVKKSILKYVILNTYIIYNIYNRYNYYIYIIVMVYLYSIINLIFNN